MDLITLMILVHKQYIRLSNLMCPLFQETSKSRETKNKLLTESLFLVSTNTKSVHLKGERLIIIITRVETIDGSANEGEDYIAVNEILTFEPYETEKEVTGRIWEFDVLTPSDRGDDRGRQPVGAGRGVLPEAVPRPGRGQQRTQARQDQHHGDHDSQRRW